MRGRMIAGGLVALGLSAMVPTMVEAGRAPERTVTRTVTHEVQRVGTPDRRVERDEHRTVRQERVVVTRERERYVPTPIVRDHYVPIVSADFDVAVNLSQVPGCVIDAANHQSGCAPIAGIEYVHCGAGTFYDVRVQRSNGCQTLRFSTDGCFQRCL